MLGLVVRPAFAGVDLSPAVKDVFRVVVEALAEQDLDRFADQFDPKMAGYADLKQTVGALIANDGVSSTIEPVTDEGDGDHHELQLDWLLRTEQGQSRRQIVKCTIERRGKNWKIVALEPLSFFKFE
jgi:hypothetical protein